MNQDQQQTKPSRLVYIEWDGFHHWEKYLVTYEQALSLIPILLPKLPSITITDYDYHKIQSTDSKSYDNRATIQDENNESAL